MYVQYAGSLVGRDFRVILQVALIVLHGLIPAAHYASWIALCRLAPLIFQPAIEDLNIYVVSTVYFLNAQLIIQYRQSFKTPYSTS
jgi:hypothetical protein